MNKIATVTPSYAVFTHLGLESPTCINLFLPVETSWTTYFWSYDAFVDSFGTVLQNIWKRASGNNISPSDIFPTM